MQKLQMLCFCFCFSLLFASTFASSQSTPYDFCLDYHSIYDTKLVTTLSSVLSPSHCKSYNEYKVGIELALTLGRCVMFPSIPYVDCRTMYECAGMCYMPDNFHSPYYGDGYEIHPKEDGSFVEISSLEPFSVTIACEIETDPNNKNYTALIIILCTVLFLVVVATIVVACCVMKKKKKTLVVEKVTDYGTTSTVCVQPQIYPQAQYVQPLLYPQPQPVQPQPQTQTQTQTQTQQLPQAQPSNQQPQPNHHQQQQPQQFYLVSNQPINSHEGQMPPMPQYMLYSQQQQQ